MDSKARDQARSLELVIRAASAEERQLGRRLARAAEAQRRARAVLAGDSPQAPQLDDGSSER